MKKLVILLVIVFTLLTGCNLVIGIIESGDDGGDGTDFVPLPDIVIVHEYYAIPYDGAVYPIGSTVKGESKIISFNIQNRGEIDLILTGSPRVQVDGAGFSLNTDAAVSIPPNNYSSFSVSFLPSEEEPYRASITVESNDTNKSPYQFYLTGTGTEIHIAKISIRYGSKIIQNGDSLDLGGFKIGNQKKEVFHLENIGSTDLVLEETPHIRVEGEGFKLINDAESPVEPDVGVTYQIGFLPTRENTYTGTIFIKSNDPEVPEFQYSILGYGINQEL